MSDGMAARVTRIISGSVHALLDAVESAAPEAVMAQAIREVDAAIDDVRGELGRVEAARYLATSSLNKLNSQNEELSAQIELAIAKQQEELARAGIARQVDIEDQIPVLSRSLQDTRDRSRELEGFITALLAKKREMEGALTDFVAARATAGVPSGTGSPSTRNAAQMRAERAGSAFDRVIAQQTGLQGIGSPVRADSAQLRELQDLARNHRIEERLAALKASKRGVS